MAQSSDILQAAETKSASSLQQSGSDLSAEELGALRANANGIMDSSGRESVITGSLSGQSGRIDATGIGTNNAFSSKFDENSAAQSKSSDVFKTATETNSTDVFKGEADRAASSGAQFSSKLGDKLADAASNVASSLGDESTLADGESGALAKAGVEGALGYRAARKAFEQKVSPVGPYTQEQLTLKKKMSIKSSAKGAVRAVIEQDDTLKVASDIDRGVESAKAAKRGFTKLKAWNSGRKAKRAAKAGDMAAQYAQRKSMQIAKAAKDAKTVQGMSVGQRIVSLFKAAGFAIVNGLQAFIGGLFSLISSIVVAATPIVGLILGGAAALVVVVTIIFSNQPEVIGLTDDQNTVYAYLSERGFSDESIAAIMGNIQWESSWDPNAVDGTGAGDSMGYWQITDDEKDLFIDWAGRNGKDAYQLETQLEWTFSEDNAGSWSGTYNGFYSHRWSLGLCRSLYYDCEPGWQSRFATDYYRSGNDFKNSEDVDLATYSWMACYERPGSGKTSGYWVGISNLGKRIDSANSFYEAIQASKGGQDYASANATQKKLVDAAKSTEYPGDGLCLKWVDDVYENAGIPITRVGRANRALDGHTSYDISDLSHLKVGMAVVAEVGYSVDITGQPFGHICIYIGDGKFMDSNGQINTFNSLDEWIKPNYRKGWIRYGYLCDESLIK